MQDYNRSGWNVTNSANILTGGPLTASQYTTIKRSLHRAAIAVLSPTSTTAERISARHSVWPTKVTDAIKVYGNWFYSHEDDTNIQYANKLYWNGGANSPPTGIDPTKPYSDRPERRGPERHVHRDRERRRHRSIRALHDTEANNFQLKTYLQQ